MLLHKSIHSVIVAPIHLDKQLKQELGTIDYTQVGSLFFIHDSTPSTYLWANTTWLQPQILKVESIKDAAKKLRQIFKGPWHSHSFHLHRRTKLIEENIKNIQVERIHYLQKDWQPFAEWLLLDENTILYSTQVTARVPAGQVEFHEDKKLPPSRAYLKLWEVFTLHIDPPNSKEVVVDLGACPGGWTWVLVNHAQQVISVDKAPLDKTLLQNSKITYLAKDAFKLKHDDIPNISWLFSDIACYPEKLLELIEYWLPVSSIKTFVCTVKLQDNYNTTALKSLQNIQDSKLIHLYQNKNELTWILQR